MLMRDYVILSIETHLFFARIMKEHALFLEAGFPCCDKECIEEAEYFRQKFEELLCDTLEIAEGNIHDAVLNSNELLTEFTIPAERRTEDLSGISIDCRISEMTRKLCCGCGREESRSLNQQVIRINERALGLLNGLIRFKENILCKVNRGQLLLPIIRFLLNTSPVKPNYTAALSSGLWQMEIFLIRIFMRRRPFGIRS